MGTHIGTRIYTALNGLQVGEDDQGNRYYVERHEPQGRRRKRWVIYNGEREASRVPPEWHGWLHYMVDETPDEAPVERRPWQAEHRPNLTGTPEALASAGQRIRRGPARRGDRRLRTVAALLEKMPGDGPGRRAGSGARVAAGAFRRRAIAAIPPA